MSAAQSIRESLEFVVARELGEAVNESAVKRLVDAFIQEEPWAPAGSVNDLINRDGVAKILGVGPRSVSEYALRDPDFPNPETNGRLWSAQKIRTYQKMRTTTRSPGRPKGSPNKKVG
ncbi:hypothetical protein [Arthrobacter glacialis]|uniref:DNA-binding protein n=1 Tax=Arthrobacter glacialis TaxID=1664 RepID=A0A2S3ZTH1_ARTGL|nr:hypothetical protein [Arthrobacter glacialis]POH72510.1 hypothetical protein CVS27_15430 [Arthrobacter glacialis]